MPVFAIEDIGHMCHHGQVIRSFDLLTCRVDDGKELVVHEVGGMLLPDVALALRPDPELRRDQQGRLEGQRRQAGELGLDTGRRLGGYRAGVATGAAGSAVVA